MSFNRAVSTPPEIVFPVLGKDIRDGPVLHADDLLVHLHLPHPGVAAQGMGNGALAAAHETDEINVGLLFLLACQKGQDGAQLSHRQLTRCRSRRSAAKGHGTACQLPEIRLTSPSFPMDMVI